MKSVDTVRDGGVIAFITSQGVMNSERNRPVREWLMSQCDLVSAIRLPNNLFTEHAGTEVGSDLIVLQKRIPPRSQAMTRRQMDFIETEVLSGVSTSKLFSPDRNERILSTGYKLDTDPYGKPAFVYTHRAGNSGLTDMEGMAKDLYEMLRQDIYRNLNLEHYHLYSPVAMEEAQAIQGRGK